MGGKDHTSPNSAVGCCDLSLKCRCRWRWDSPSFSRNSHRTCPIPPALAFLLALSATLVASAIVFMWITFPPFSRDRTLSGFGCQEDNEGSWAIGVYFGPDPFSLRPIELENLNNDGAAAWPVANPILSCASASNVGHLSNFVADPFLFLQGEALYLFFESKNGITKQGDIGVAKSLDGGITWRYLGVALDEEWHLSYPFIFEYNGQIYMMPEGSQKGDLRLYRALEFPLHWTLDRVIINKPLVDASLVEYEGQFWIFASDFHRFGAHKNGELEIYYANSPLGPWQSHKKNPVHNGDRKFGARNGGRPFLHDGRLYRVGQDCGETYGQNIRIFHVKVLSTDEFEEVEVPFTTNEPKKGRNSWNGMRRHNLDVQRLSSGGWIAVMDGDRVPSGDLFRRYAVGSLSLLVLILLILLTAFKLGISQCVLPSSKFFNAGKRNDSFPVWMRPHMTSRLHGAFSRLNRSNPSIPKLSTCSNVGFLSLCFIISVACLCIGIRCYLGDNGAEEPYSVGNQFSQFTMLTMTYDARLWNLKMYVNHYSRCASVREIVVVWNKGQPPNPKTDFDSAVPVRVRVEEKNSLNNRFKPDHQIKTRAVLELDDDIMMTCDDVERGFKAWRQHPDRIVGFYPRLIDGTPLKYRNEKYARSRREYNMILTGAAFIDSSVAFAKYWSEEAKRGRTLVDKLFNCEDILLNFLIANSSQSRTVEYIRPAWALDTSKFSSSAISRDTEMHYMKRTNCLNRFSQLYGTLPLKSWEFDTRQDHWDS